MSVPPMRTRSAFKGSATATDKSAASATKEDKQPASDGKVYKV